MSQGEARCRWDGSISQFPSQFPVSTRELRWGDKQGLTLEAVFPGQPPPSPALVQPSRPPARVWAGILTRVGLGKSLALGKLPPSHHGITQQHRILPSHLPLELGWGPRSGQRQAGSIPHLGAISEPNSVLMQAGSQVNCTNLGLFWALQIYLPVAHRLLSSQDQLVFLFRDGV